MLATAVVTAAASYPVTGTEAKAWARVETTSDDTLIDGLIASATTWAQAYTGRQFITATYDLQLDDWPCDWIEVPYPPLASVTHVKYYDTGGTLTTWGTSSYTVDTASEPGRIYPASTSVIFPTLHTRIAGAISTRFVCGYGTASSVPESIKTAIKLVVSTNYEFREALTANVSIQEVPFAAKALLDPHRTWLAGLT